MSDLVSILQLSGCTSASDPFENYKYLVDSLQGLEAIDILVTGEMFLSRDVVRYSDENFWRELIQVLKLIEVLAVENNLAISVGYPHKMAEGIKIRQSVFFPNKSPYHYDKVHLGKNEMEHYIPGDTIDVFTYRGVCYGIQLCIDTHVAEMTIMQKLKGASVILAPFNTPYRIEKRLTNWMKYIPTRGYEYNLCICCQNTSGGILATNGHGMVMEHSLLSHDKAITVIDNGGHYRDRIDFMSYRRSDLYEL